LRLHPRTEAVFLRPAAPVGLECALGHEKYWLLISKSAEKQTLSINDAAATSKPPPAGNWFALPPLPDREARRSAKLRFADFVSCREVLPSLPLSPSSRSCA
jgi:hypothetical protein